MNVEKRLMNCLLYLVLLTGGLIFCAQTFQKFRDGNTSYIIQSEAITLNDLPTLTTCMLNRRHASGGIMKYGKEF